MQKLLTDTYQRLSALVSRSEVSGGGGTVELLTVFYIAKQGALLSGLDRLGDVDIARV